MEVYLFGYNSMGKASRFDGDINGRNNPGPGSYEQHSTFGGPKTIMTGRKSKSVSSLGPGPGQYNPSKSMMKSTTLQYSISGKCNYNGKDSTPGPGSYDLVDHRRKKEVRIGREKRQ